MLNHKNLIFFNKEGDALNFTYNESVDRFEGSLLFHENSNDTFKTYGLYMFESVPSFEFDYAKFVAPYKDSVLFNFCLYLFA